MPVRPFCKRHALLHDCCHLRSPFIKVSLSRLFMYVSMCLYLSSTLCLSGCVCVETINLYSYLLSFVLDMFIHLFVILISSSHLLQFNLVLISMFYNLFFLLFIHFYSCHSVSSISHNRFSTS